MAGKARLPYWAEEYVNHIRQYRPRLYRDLKTSGQLETVSLSVQESASLAYDQLVAYYQASGDNEATAKAFAQSEIMRQYICLPDERDVPVIGEQPEELPESTELAWEETDIDLDLEDF